MVSSIGHRCRALYRVTPRMLDVDAIMSPWWDRLQADFGELDLYDAHTHIGADDPDGMRQTAGELVASLERVQARAVVFPMHEPTGYPLANDRVLEAADASAGRLVAFCRVDPHAHALPEARRCLDAGARGIKLHPRAEQFTLSEPAVRDADRARPRAARAGADPRRPRDPGARARHRAAVRRVPARAADPRARRDLRPRVAVARAARPSEPVHRHGVVGPGGHDGPVHARAAGERAVGERRAVRAAAHVGGDAPAPRRPGGPRRACAAVDRGRADGAPAQRRRRRSTRVRRRSSRGRSTRCSSGSSRTRAQAVARTFGEGDPEEPVALARLACAVGDDGPHADVFAAVLELLDLYEENLAPPPPGRRFPLAVRLLVAACTIARTPDVPACPRRSRSGCRTGRRRDPRRALGAPRRPRRGRA